MEFHKPLILMKIQPCQKLGKLSKFLMRQRLTGHTQGLFTKLSTVSLENPNTPAGGRWKSREWRPAGAANAARHVRQAIRHFDEMAAGGLPIFWAVTAKRIPIKDLPRPSPSYPQPVHSTVPYRCGKPLCQRRAVQPRLADGCSTSAAHFLSRDITFLINQGFRWLLRSISTTDPQHCPAAMWKSAATAEQATDERPIRPSAGGWRTASAPLQVTDAGSACFLGRSALFFPYQ